MKNNGLMTRIKTVTTWLFLTISIILLAYLSFLENVRFAVEIKKVAVFAVVASVLAIAIWNMFYTNYYDKIINNDLNKGKFGVHMKYYYSRDGFTEDVLRDRIEKHNLDAKNSWLKDVQTVTGRSIESIKRGGYRKNSHKLLIWKVKHNKAPKTGIKYAKQLLNILSVNYSDSYRYKLNRDKTVYWARLARKIITTTISLWFGAMITADFIKGNYMEAVLTLSLSLLVILSSVFGGTLVGIRAGKIKLAIAEDITRLLLSWKTEPDIKSKLVVTVKEDEYDAFSTKLIDKNKEKEQVVKSNLFDIDVS